MNSTHLPIFDGHNDTITQTAVRPFLQESEEGHLDLPRARQGGFAGGLFAVFINAKSYQYPDCSAEPPEDIPVTEDYPNRAIHPDFARRATIGLTAKLFEIETASKGEFRVAEDIETLRRCLDTGTIAAVLHFEGAEAIDTDLAALEVFYRAGLRSLGITWSRHNRFGFGTPAHRMGSPDEGPGLTEAGINLVEACTRLGILVDVSHLNQAGFFDVIEHSVRPIAATHSNAFALCGNPRNLTDSQIDAIGENGGVIGLNFHVGFLREDGDHGNDDVTLHRIVEHGKYIADRIGPEHLALGSDFDGATIPREMKDAAGLPRLVEAFRRGGFSEEELHGICSENWLRLLETVWQ